MAQVGLGLGDEAVGFRAEGALGASMRSAAWRNYSIWGVQERA